MLRPRPDRGRSHRSAFVGRVEPSIEPPSTVQDAQFADGQTSDGTTDQFEKKPGDRIHENLRLGLMLDRQDPRSIVIVDARLADDSHRETLEFPYGTFGPRNRLRDFHERLRSRLVGVAGCRVVHVRHSARAFSSHSRYQHRGPELRRYDERRDERSRIA